MSKLLDSADLVLDPNPCKASGKKKGALPGRGLLNEFNSDAGNVNIESRFHLNGNGTYEILV